MPSSTSSFDPFHRVPKVRLWHRWAAGAAIVVVCVIAAETALRALGHQPSVRESPAIWAVQYRKIEDMGPKDVVLLGDSRMQMGFSLDAFRERYPDREIVQLAFAGTTSNPALHAIADESAFSGTVIYGVSEYRMIQSPRGVQALYIAFAERAMPIDLFEARLRASIQSRFVVAAYHLNALQVLDEYLKHGTVPPANYHSMRPDRARLADFARVDVTAIRNERIERSIGQAQRRPIPPPEEWLLQVQPLEDSVRRIHERGGQVVFVQFPLQREHAALYEERAPKARYWDVFAEASAAETVHYADYETLRSYDCPDNVHLDASDMAPFTHDLLDILEARGVFD